MQVHSSPARVRPKGAALAWKLDSWRTYVYWVAALFHMEMVYKLAVFGRLSAGALVYTLLFSAFAGALCLALTSFFPPKANGIVAVALSGALFLFFGVHFIYIKVFTTPLTAGVLGIAGQAAGFASVIGSHVLRYWYVILLFLIPAAFTLAAGRRLVRFRSATKTGRFLTAGLVVGSYLLCLLSLTFSGGGETSARSLYFKLNDIESTQYGLGLLTASRLDAQRSLFGFKDTYRAGTDDPTLAPPASDPAAPAGNAAGTTAPLETQPPRDYGCNVMDIDFDKLIAEAPNDDIRDLHEYFSRVKPTSKHQYTGLFKDCNLIQITAEAFWKYGISKTHTPTLYKLSQEGIQFKKYYNTLWGGSTTSGEFTSMFGLVSSEARPLEASIGKYLPFALGNQFGKLSGRGYGQPFAYHNHKGSMYNRETTHPNLGYTFKSTTNGLEAMAEGWPRSDEEMARLTMPDYISQERFHAYYMTVSGHTPYTFSGNSCARRHQAAVEDLKDVYGDAARGYIATQIELDKMLETLLDGLEKAGKLDNTVIVINGDHYPYTSDFAEGRRDLAGRELDPFELQESSLIIWKPGMPRITVEKPASSLDIIPTVSNLFGLEYDSRLFSGQDALAPDRDDIIAMLDNKWVTSVCAYTPRDGVVKVYGDEPPTDDYIKGVRTAVRNRTNYAYKLLHSDYYAYVFGKK